VICYRGLFFRSYALLQFCGSSECYTYVRVFKHVGNCSYFWAMVGESGPDLDVFLFRILVGFFLYLSIEFLKQLLWHIVVFRYCLYCFLFFMFFFVWV
jgi:hypothetical protein